MILMSICPYVFFIFFSQPIGITVFRVQLKDALDSVDWLPADVKVVEALKN